jgi:hypothetical protein
MEEDELRRFVEDLVALCGEVPVATIVAKVKVATGDDDGQVRRVMGLLAFMAAAAGQSDEPLELRARDQMVEVIFALGLPTREEGA